MMVSGKGTWLTGQWFLGESEQIMVILDVRRTGIALNVSAFEDLDVTS